MRYTQFNKLNKLFKKSGKWLRLGTCTLILGASSLLMSPGGAFAGSIFSLSSTLEGDSVIDPILIVDPDDNNTFVNSLDNGDFTIINQNGTKLGDGVDERTIGIFNFTTDPNWGGLAASGDFELLSATLTFVLTSSDKFVNSDAFFIDFTFTANGNVELPGALPKIFLFAPFTPGPGLILPELPFTEEIFTMELLDFYSEGDLRGRLFDGNAGELNLRYGDDAIMSFANLELIALSSPEPGTLLLLGSGLVGLAVWRLKKKGVMKKEGAA